MADEPSDGSEASLDPVVVHAKAMDHELHPDLDSLQSTMLSKGARTFKEARHTVMRNRHTGAVHHDALTIRTVKRVKGEEIIDDKHTVYLSGKSDDDQIAKLIVFLNMVRSDTVPTDTGRYLVVAAPTGEFDCGAFQRLLNTFSATGKADALASVLEQASDDPAVFRALVERASKDPLMFTETAAALNLAVYKEAIEELRQLIEEDAREPKFQEHLTKHPWMFGSEYSELLTRRAWTRDERQDFMVRRTTDGYIEAIEIKTPLGGAPLFNYDSSHDSYYAGAELSKVVGQVEKYILELDANRKAIQADDKEDTLKIRAKIIIGRDRDEEQLSALRTHNGHLERIEVMTFDQLLRVAERVTAYLASSLEKTVVT